MDAAGKEPSGRYVNALGRKHLDRLTGTGCSERLLLFSELLLKRLAQLSPCCCHPGEAELPSGGQRVPLTEPSPQVRFHRAQPAPQPPPHAEGTTFFHKLLQESSALTPSAPI